MLFQFFYPGVKTTSTTSTTYINALSVELNDINYHLVEPFQAHGWGW
jgi:hypothetical protein